MLRLALALILLAAPGRAADFRLLAGHGGPVMGVAISGDGRTALTASFDNSVGVWDLASDEVRFLEGQEAAVKAVVFMGSDAAASAGDDFAIELWDLTTGKARARLTGHKGQVKSLAVSPDGKLLASAGWDGSIGLWDIAAAENIAMMRGHDGAVNDVAFSVDGSLLYSASADGTVRVWDVAARAEKRVLVRHGFGVTVLAVRDGWLAYGAVDGGTRVIDLATDKVLADLTLERRPILAFAMTPAGDRLAVGDGQGYVMTVDTHSWQIVTDYRLSAHGPVWALAFTPDGTSLLAGGVDDAAYLWPVENRLEAPIMATVERGFHREPGTMSNGERQFMRKCSICHSLTGEGVRRAGPTLKGLFGRKAGSVPGYLYSEAVGGLGLTWSDHTVDELFDQGPAVFIPGTKMPNQRIVRPEDRRDLIEYLRNNT